MNPQLNGRHHDAIRGLPEKQIYCWVQGKAPKYDRWNDPKNLLTPDQLFNQAPPDTLQPNGFGMVSGRWSGTMAVDFDTNPDFPQRSEEVFRRVTGYASDHLPPSATVVSGRPGRRRVILGVPPEWKVCLSGWSADLQDLEFRWEAGGSSSPAPIQSVICGDHPDDPNWKFRWQEGLSPNEVGIAEAPIWLLAAMVRQRGIDDALKENDEEGGGGGRAAGEPGPCDLLDPKQQKKLIREVLSPAWPYRGGAAGSRYAGSWKADDYSSLIAGLFNVLGVAIAEEWLKGTDWLNNHEDFGTYNDLGEAMRSIGKSKTSKKAGWGTLVALATRTGRTDHNGQITELFSDPPAKLPKWALPPREVNAVDLQSECKKKVGELKAALLIVDQLDTPLERAIATMSVRDQLNIRDREMPMVISQLEEEESDDVTADGGFLDEVIANQKPIDVAIERFLPFGAITILGADPGTGKSVFIYRVAEAAAYGRPLFGELQTVQGNVLVVQKDESGANLKQKATLMGFKDPEHRIKVHFKFSGGHFPELVKWIKEHNARYVVMDSFASLFSGGADLKEADAGLYLYRLNQIASEFNCAILLTHHLKKTLGGDRTDVRLGDFYGSAFIGAGTSDAWGLFRDPEVTDDVAFLLKNVKPRSGIAQLGDQFRLLGSMEDLSLVVDSLNEVHKIEGLRAEERMLLKELTNFSEEDPALVGEVGVDGSLAHRCGMNKKRINRIITTMYPRNIGIQRRKLHGARARGGPAPFGYWIEN